MTERIKQVTIEVNRLLCVEQSLKGIRTKCKCEKVNCHCCTNLLDLVNF